MIGINELIIYFLLQIIPSTIFLIRCIEILKIIKQKNQEITKNQLFILYIPIIGMIWVFIVIYRINNSLKRVLNTKDYNQIKLNYINGLLFCLSLIPLFNLIFIITNAFAWKKIKILRNSIEKIQLNQIEKNNLFPEENFNYEKESFNKIEEKESLIYTSSDYVDNIRQKISVEKIDISDFGRLQSTDYFRKKEELENNKSKHLNSSKEKSAIESTLFDFYKEQIKPKINNLGINKLNSDEIIILSIIIGTLLGLLLGYYFGNTSYYDRNGNRTHFSEHYSEFHFNYVIAISSFIVFGGTTYIFLNRKNSKNE